MDQMLFLQLEFKFCEEILNIKMNFLPLVTFNLYLLRLARQGVGKEKGEREKQDESYFLAEDEIVL